MTKKLSKKIISLLVAGTISASFLFGQGGMPLHVDGQLHYGFLLEDPFEFEDALANMRLGADANLFFMPADFLPLGETVTLGGLLGVRGTYDDNFYLDIPVGLTTLHEFSDAFHLQPFLGVNNMLIMGDDSDYDLSVLVGAKAVISSVIVSIDYQLKFLIDTVHVMQLGVGYRFSMM